MDLLTVYGAAGLSGALIGLLLTVFGGGGSVLAAPLLIFFVGVADPHVAIGTSAAAVSVNALMGLIAQARAGAVKWPCALVFGGFGLGGALIGAHIAKMIDGGVLLLGFAGIMALVGVSMLRKARTAGDPLVHLDPRLARRLAPLGFGTGLAAGFFGIGGGFLIAPGLMAATGMTLAHAAASSLVSVTLFGAATSATYAISGLVDWRLVAALVTGGAAGIALGLPIARRLGANAALARRLFAGMIVLVAIYVAWKAVAGL